MLEWFQDDVGPKYRKFVVGWANRHLSSLERWLDGREYIASDSFTIADILMTHVLAVIKDDALFQPYSNVRNYRDRCLARPAWQHTIDRYYKNVEAG